jgi:PAS domain S-box-containing protein
VKLNQRLAALPGVEAWPRRRIAWIGGALITVIVAFAAYDLGRSYRQAVADTRRELDSQSRVIAEQTARSVQAVDVMLRQVAAEYKRGRLTRLTADELHVYLRDIAVGLNQVDGLGVFDAAGEQVAVSWPAPRRAVNMASLPRFQQLRDDPSHGFVIFGAARAAGEGHWIVPFGRRLETPDGVFAGVVAARGRVEYFERFYGDAYPDPATRVALLHRDTTLLARHPPSAAQLGQRFAALEGLLPGPDGSPRASRGISPVDGVDRFAAIRLVPDYPLVVVVTREARAALAAWRSQAIGSAWRTLALGTLAALLLALLWRHIARFAAARASLALSEERYALAAAGSDTGVWDWDLVAGTGYESRRARELQGLPLEPETQPLEELKGRLTYHPDDAERRSSAMQAHLDGRTPHYEVEYRVRRADGRYAWIHVRALCTRDAAGKPLRIAGSVTDIDDRKRAEEALRVSEERYALAMTGSDEGHWLWDIPAGRVYISERMAALMGLAGGAQELTDAEYFARIPLHPEDRERVHRNRNNHVAGLTPRLDHEFRIVRPDSGEVRWMHTRAQVFRDEQGRPLRLAGSTVDETQRKHAEEALRLSEQRFADAVAGSDDGVWEWDYTTGMAFVSARGREIVGLPPGPEVMPIEQHLAQMRAQLHPDDVPRREQAIEDHLAGRAPAYVGDFRARQPDGSYRWVHVHGRAVRDASGALLRMAGCTTDIDDRKRAEDALRESQERYALAMTGSRGGHWVWDVARDQLFASRTLYELFGLPLDTPPGTRSDFLARVRLHPDDRDRVLKLIEDSVQRREARTDYECRILLPDDSVRWILNRAQRFSDEQGTRIAGVSVDITERKQAEDQRERLEQQLRQAQKLEAIGTLAGGIAHDFNNILSAILGYGELALKGAAEGSAQRRHIDAALAAGQRAKSLVERILAFSRSGVGERVPVHVQSVVAEALDGVTAALPGGVTLERHLAAGDAAVQGDPTQIHQVVMNLCANAVQAMRGEGRLVVTLDVQRFDAPLAVATNTLATGSYVRLAVADSGSGIEPRLLERIFDPFFTTKEVGVGTGLGLSLVHGIVTDLDGGIDVHSRIGEGSRFTIHLPSTGVVAAPAADAGSDDQLQHGDGQTVLLVDDEEPLVRLGEELLAGLGYEPVGHVSSRAALAALEADPQRFDAVLSDESMPGLTGSELALQAHRLRPGLPVVLMSGFVSPALLQQARAAGVAEVLTKPLAAREIARALAAALRTAPASAKLSPEKSTTP